MSTPAVQRQPHPHHDTEHHLPTTASTMNPGTRELLTLATRATATRKDTSHDTHDLINEASELAWTHRWSNWPTSAHDIDTAATSIPPVARRFAYWCAARRIHYSFAYTLLQKFTGDAINLLGHDDFLEMLNCAAAVAAGDTSRWDELHLKATSPSNIPEDRKLHILLTTTFTAAHVPDRILHSSLERAKQAASTGDVVAAYRVVSLLRRSGHLVAALTAADAACQTLIESCPGGALGEHLSERLVAERALITSHLDATPTRVQQRQVNRSIHDPSPLTTMWADLHP